MATIYSLMTFAQLQAIRSECHDQARTLGYSAHNIDAIEAEIERRGAHRRTHVDTPLTRCSAAALPLLIRAHDELTNLAAPRASDLSHRIGLLLEA